MLMKNLLTPAGIEPATFLIVAQHLNHYASLYDGGPIILQYIITILTTVLQIAYTLQYSNMLYRFAA